ncbi:MAG: hypothetical protein WA160_05770 [Pseudobdellovibrio sp.]
MSKNQKKTTVQKNTASLKGIKNLKNAISKPVPTIQRSMNKQLVAE